ncbi:MAG: T9SS type A sorting domain-containing protein [Bacteroidota bacterium]|nr:T9SS type A sorting domain-containing protein [Bacteroidota bacterium]
MKTKNLQKRMAAVLICLAMAFAAKAQTTALTLSDLQTQFAAAVASGVPATINVGASIIVNADLSLVSTGDSIALNFTSYAITVTSGTFTIGNKVKITSTLGNAIQALAGGTVIINAGCCITSSATSPVTAAGGNVIINGGKIFTSNFPAASAGLSGTVTGGTLTINGGRLYTNATGTARGVGIDYLGTCIVNGGEIHSDMGGGRGISINATGAGGKLYVNGGTITALGATGRAIQADNGNAFVWISGSPVINGGLEAIIAQKYAVVVVGGTPTLTGVIGTNLVAGSTPAWNPVLYDARAINITATPTTGYYAVSQPVTVASGTMSVLKYTGASSGGTGPGVTNPVTVTPTTLVYTTDGTYPIATSTAYTAPVTMAIPSVLNVAPIIEGTAVGASKVFNYWPLGVPMTAAPMPTAYTTAKEISIFSDAFPNVANTNFTPGWGQTTVASIVKIAGVNTLKYANLNYEGIEIGSDVNAVPMKYLHLDVWTSDATSLQIYPISRSTGDTRFYTAGSLVANSWNSIDIPLTYFTNLGLNVSDIFQFKFVGSGTVYVQNLYFYDNTTTVDTQVPTDFTASTGAITSTSVELLLKATDDSGAVNYTITYGTTSITVGGVSGVQKSYVVIGLNGSTAYSFSVTAKDLTGNIAANSPIVVSATTLVGLQVPSTSAPTPTVDAAKVMSIYSDAYTPITSTINYNPNWSQTTLVTTFNVGTDATMKYENFNYQGIDLGGVIDLSNMTKVHIDVFTPNETSITFQPISTPSGTKVALTPLALNVWNSYDIPLSSFTGLNKTGVFQVMFNDGTKKIAYIDNIYFYNDETMNVATVAGSSVKCYPSQVTANVKVTADTEISTVTVHNLVGQSVKSVVVNSNEKSIDLSAVPGGNYFVTVKLANGQSSTQKIVKL